MKGKCQVKIYRLELESFERWEESIQKQIKEIITINFPQRAIEEEYYQNKSKEMRQYLAENRAVIFLAEEDNELAGWIWGYEKKQFDIRRLHIAFFSVVSKKRRNGIGKALLNLADQYAKSMGLDGMELLVTNSNYKAVEFYRHAGFEEERLLLAKRF